LEGPGVLMGSCGTPESTATPPAPSWSSWAPTSAPSRRAGTAPRGQGCAPGTTSSAGKPARQQDPSRQLHPARNPDRMRARRRPHQGLPVRGLLQGPHGAPGQASAPSSPPPTRCSESSTPSSNPASPTGTRRPTTKPSWSSGTRPAGSPCSKNTISIPSPDSLSRTRRLTSRGAALLAALRTSRLLLRLRPTGTATPRKPLPRRSIAPVPVTQELPRRPVFCGGSCCGGG